MTLFTEKGLFTESGKRVPLKAVDVAATVVGLVADVTIIHVYENEIQENAVEVLYKFPIDDAAAVYSFQADVDGEIVVGVLKEKTAAQSEYQQAIKNGKFASIVDDKGTDVFQIKLGNFRKSVKITLCYCCLLKYEDDRAVFFIPTTLAPRYNPDGYTFENNVVSQTLYGLSVSLTCSGTVTSPSHTFSCINGNIVLINQPMDRDVIFYIYQSFEEIFAICQKMSDENYVVAVTEIPKFDEGEKICADLIFLIDRSGSMSGKPILQAREAMNIILHSIPNDSYFNIIGFGNRFENLFPESQKYDEQSLSIAKTYVDNMESNMGGTEIYAPLKFVLEKNSPEGYQKQIFLLTDGEVADVDRLFDLVKTRGAGCRVFSLGLGSSACHNLVNGIARAGNGTSLYASFSEKLEEKMLKQLEYALRPSKKMNLNWNALKTIPINNVNLFKGTATTVFGFFDKEILSVNDVMCFRMEDGQTLARLAVKRSIQEIEDLDRSTDFSDRLEIVKLSLEYGVASKFTSFVVTGKDCVYETPAEFCVVPNQINYVTGACVTDSGSLMSACSLASAGSFMAASASKCRIAPPSTKPVANFNSVYDVVKYIINLQKFDGSFVLDDKIAEKIKPLPLFSKTAFVVAYLEKNCMEAINTWRLVVEKARRYLERQHLLYEIDQIKF